MGAAADGASSCMRPARRRRRQAGPRASAVPRPRKAAKAKRRIITGIASGCRSRLLEAGAGALADYELLELILFRAIPRRDVKPLAKALDRPLRLVRRGDRRGAGAAGRSRGDGRGRDRRVQDRRGRRAALRQGRGQEAAADGLVERGDRLLPHLDGVRGRVRSSASSFSIARTGSSPTRFRGRAPSITPRSIRAK